MISCKLSHKPVPPALLFIIHGSRRRIAVRVHMSHLGLASHPPKPSAKPPLALPLEYSVTTVLSFQCARSCLPWMCLLSRRARYSIPSATGRNPELAATKGEAPTANRRRKDRLSRSFCILLGSVVDSIARIAVQQRFT